MGSIPHRAQNRGGNARKQNTPQGGICMQWTVPESHNVTSFRFQNPRF